MKLYVVEALNIETGSVYKRCFYDRHDAKKFARKCEDKGFSVVIIRTEDPLKTQAGP